VQSPGQNRGQGEQRQAHSYDDAGDGSGEHGCEALDGQGRTGVGTELDVVHTHAQQHHQGGHGADHDGVHEDLEHTVNALLHRVIHVGGGVGDGGGAQAGLIGEDTPADTPDDGLTDAYAGQTAGHGGGVEGAHKDSPEGVGDLGEIRNDHDDRRGHIDNGHNGNHQGAHVAQALDAAHQNDEDD